MIVLKNSCLDRESLIPVCYNKIRMFNIMMHSGGVSINKKQLHRLPKHIKDLLLGEEGI